MWREAATPEGESPRRNMGDVTQCEFTVHRAALAPSASPHNPLTNPMASGDTADTRLDTHTGTTRHTQMKRQAEWGGSRNSKTTDRLSGWTVGSHCRRRRGESVPATGGGGSVSLIEV